MVVLVEDTAAILLFDLIAYLIRRNAAFIGQSKGRNYKLFVDEDFDQLGPTFKLVLFVWFQSEAEFPYLTLLRSLQQLTEKYQLGNFELHVNFSKETRRYWEDSYLNAQIRHDASKFIVGGSEVFSWSVKMALARCGFSTDLLTEL